MGIDKKKIAKISFAVLAIIMLVTIFSYFNHAKSENELVINNKNSKQFAVYIKNESGSFEEYKDNNRLFPANYVLNLKESKCNYADSTNPISPITEVLNSDGRTVTVKSSKTVYCKLYFEDAFAKMLHYDNKISKSKCEDVQCALDDLYNNSHKVERS